MPCDINLSERLRQFGQEHVLKWWDELNDAQRAELEAQAASLDLPLIDRLFRQAQAKQSKAAQSAGTTGETDDSPEARARRARPPAEMVKLPASEQEVQQWRRAVEAGEELLAQGKVGAVLVAGGQGTRLRFDHAKGMFPIGPVSRKSLYQLLAEQLIARGRRAGVRIPFYVMTSDATHAETVEFFTAHDFFGLEPGDVHFFQQGNMPSVDAASGRLLMDEKWRIASGPDGHGGMVGALARSGLLRNMADRGVEQLFYMQVDNPLAKVCDPAFLGWHRLHNSQISTKVVSKRDAADRMGVLVELDGRTQIIEYSDLPDDVAAQRDASGRLLLWAGNTAMHVFERAFLERLAASEESLPFHIAHKAVKCLDPSGERLDPTSPNAFKFERFIFDALPLADVALVVEADRQTEFSPVKNESGEDSPERAEASLIRLHADWLRGAGASVDDGAVVEISPLFALDAGELAAKIPAGTRVSGRRYFARENE